MTTSTLAVPGVSSKSRRTVWIVPTLIIVGLLLVWEVLVRVTGVPAFLLPAPSDIAVYMVRDWQVLLAATLSTSYITLVGFALAVVIGLVLAVLLVMSERVERALYPLIIIVQVIPKVAIAPVLVVWLGFGDAPKLTLTVLIAFLPVVLNAVLGMKSLNPDLVNLYRSLKATRFQEFVHLRFPNAIPYIVEGAKMAVMLALIGAVVGEFTSGTAGLGYLIASSSARLETVRAFATFPILAVIGIIFFYGIDFIGRVLAPWNRKF